MWVYGNVPMFKRHVVHRPNRYNLLNIPCVQSQRFKTDKLITQIRSFAEVPFKRIVHRNIHVFNLDHQPRQCYDWITLVMDLRPRDTVIRVHSSGVAGVKSGAISRYPVSSTDVGSSTKYTFPYLNPPNDDGLLYDVEDTMSEWIVWEKVCETLLLKCRVTKYLEFI